MFSSFLRLISGNGCRPWKYYIVFMWTSVPGDNQITSMLHVCYSQQRCNQAKYRELLAQRAQQFRAIQRRLLTRFKDKTPAPLANLDTLLDGTYRQVIKLKKHSSSGLMTSDKGLVSPHTVCTLLSGRIMRIQRIIVKPKPNQSKLP